MDNLKYFDQLAKDTAQWFVDFSLDWSMSVPAPEILEDWAVDFDIPENQESWYWRHMALQISLKPSLIKALEEAANEK